MTIVEENQQLVADTVSFARSYQLEALDKALRENTIVFFETGTGKTLIAIMLLRSYAHLLRKPSPFIAVFLVPTVVLVNQQSGVVAMHTDLNVGKYYGEMGVDFWDDATWKQELTKYEVLVMTPQILLDALRHTFVRMDQIKVLIFDECHNARGKHQYACIMTEFYHRGLASKSMQLPRVFGMTASPIKAKASSSSEDCWNQISELENLMHSKVYTCESDSVLTRYIPFSTPKLKFYSETAMPCTTFKTLEVDLQKLAEKHISTLSRPSITPSVAKSAREKLEKLLSILRFCLTELGIWLALKAAEVYSRDDGNIFICGGNTDIYGEKVVKAFSSDVVKVLSAQIPKGPQWLIGNNLIENMAYGYLTSKIVCLVETLLEYRELKDLRCIVFVQRIVTAIVIRSLLNELLPEVTGWRTEYTAGHSSRFQSQSRKDQNAIVDEFRKGTVNIIIATSMLEEGLDVPSCNLIIRFDPSATICSFIQSRGRARMQNSDFVLMVNSDDSSALTRVNKYLASGDMMRQECLSHANFPCQPIHEEMHGEPWYEVESTGAIVTLSSSVPLLHYYCSRLPSDRYFKPYPICTIDKVLGSCTLQLPHGCPVRTITVSGTKSLKQLACLEACKELHRVRALTDNLIPDLVEEEREPQEFDCEPYSEERAKYFPQELIGSRNNELKTVYYCYSIGLQPHFQYDVKPRSIMLAVHEILDRDLEDFSFDLDADRGKMSVHMKLVGQVPLAADEVAICQQFQIKLFDLLLKRHIDGLQKYDQHFRNKGSVVFNYLLIPTLGSYCNISVDWSCIRSVLYPKHPSSVDHTKCFSSKVHTKNELVCRCTIENSLVCTPHNGFLYCIIGTLDGVRGDTYFTPRDGESITYKEYYKQRHGITLQYERVNLLNGKHIFTVHNYLQQCRIPNKKDPSYSSCELPPELCSIIMSPISISTLYSFSFLPSVMHRIESLMLAANLKSIPMGHYMQNVEIPAIKVLEAITTKKCQEELHLESLETLGDSFLKYAASQQLFKTHQNRHEGLLSLKRQRMISNVALCKLGCDRKIPGFIRTDPFDLKSWMIPGVGCGYDVVEKEKISTSRKVYTLGSRAIKSKGVADVVEALIGAFLSAAGEKAALSFMVWLGMEIDFETVSYTRSFVKNPEIHINIKYLESLLKYTFLDTSLLVEALTHGSYMRPEIPGCYQRLEFLGDAVLDYLITVHLYHKYPGLSPGMLTDLRSASVNNDCYALSAIKARLHKHILHLSPDLHRHIVRSIDMSEEQLRSLETFGWESDTTLPKVLGDVIESLAGAIYIDSGHDKETVFRSMKPLLEPLVTIETLRLHPKRELNQLCQKEKYTMHKTVVTRHERTAYATVKIEARGIVYEKKGSAKDWKLAERLACKDILKSLKASMDKAMEGVASALSYASTPQFRIPKPLDSAVRVCGLPPLSLSSLRFRNGTTQIQFSRLSSSSRGKAPSATTPEVGVSTDSETSEWAMQDFYTLRKDVETVSERVEEIRAGAGLKQLEKNLAELEEASGDSSLWDDRVKAQHTLQALTDVKEKLKLLNDFKAQAEEAETIVNLTEEMDSIDKGLLEEAVGIIKELRKALDRFELTQLLSGPYDKEGAVVSITAGAGGTDAQDWADMLLRMYVRWGEKQRFKTKVVEKSMGEEAGIKSATIEMEGRYVYGYISGEKGTHRIVRQSPFNSKGLRQTSFSGVEVMPLLPEDSLNVEIPEEDLEYSFSRAGGKGGQNVNKIESAVRITHIPTGVTVRCTEERSQLANKIKGLSRLKAKLLVIAVEQRASEIKQIKGDTVKAEWGQQIRNYVFHPYKLVKDVRTGHETSDIASVMDGELEPFIKAYLKYKYTNSMEEEQS